MTTTTDPNAALLLSSYELQYLVEHTVAAGLVAEVVRLLNLETGDGNNLWYEAKMWAGDPAGYASDVRRAWNSLQGTTWESGLREFRFAAMLASVGGMNARMVPELFESLLTTGMW
jgi:hypothetical protein